MARGSLWRSPVSSPPHRLEYARRGLVKLAFQAYQAWKTQQTPPPPAQVEGYSDDQLYFLGYGQSWCDKMTPEALETLAHANPHSPPKFRVNGVVQNLPELGKAFGCKVGQPMMPAQTCRVW